MCANSPDTVDHVASKFGMAYIRAEGAPMHPEDIHCGLEPGTEAYEKQLKAYNDYQ